MKTILLLGLLLAPCALRAESGVCASSATMNVVSVASFTATNVDSSAVVLLGRKYVEVINTSTVTVTCGFKTGVTNGAGKLLAASGGSWTLNLADQGSQVVITNSDPFRVETRAAMGLWCIGAGTNITSSVALVQCQ